MKIVPAESMAAVVDGGKNFPPGFRFHPTDEELVLYYLKRKICRRPLKLDIIAETDVYKWDPEDLPGQSKLRTGDRQWFFFSPRDRKYPNGARSNRATLHGYWKATGKDRTITCNSRSVGVKKTLVFYLGRAPSGQRTDWVMHEYTLDEDELKRCKTAYDYYALYKVYKKSGPGPKNGEQYGAPFNEEEWEDGYVDMNGLTKQATAIVPVADGVDKVQSVAAPLNELEEFLNKLSDNQPMLAPRVPYAFDLIVGQEDNHNMFFPDHNTVAEPDLGVSFAHSATSHLQLQETSEVTSAPKISGEEDFLEIDDLIGSPLNVSNVEPLGNNLQCEHFDGLGAFELCNGDSLVFPSDCSDMVGLINQENGFEDPACNSYYNSIGDEGSDYQLHPDQFDRIQINPDLWTNDQGFDDFNPPIAPSSGALVENSNNNTPIKEDDGSESWFSAALWSFLDSIPSTPASASESSALVNKAFERMSSFGRARMNARMFHDAEVDQSSSNLRRSGRSSRGIFYFSVLGVLFAILWVLVATSSRVMVGYL